MRIPLIVGLLLLSVPAVFAQKSPHGDLKLDCDVCHSADSWTMRNDAKFDHKTTGFALTGAHAATHCASCHVKLVFHGAQQECNECHADVHKADLGQNCTRCHTTTAWRIPDMIQRHAQTRFPLIGPHAAAQCDACHAGTAEHRYSGTPTTCIGCHNVDYQATQNPNHASSGFSTDCTQCHLLTAANWGGAGFDHQLTVFPLLGAHRSVPCLNCHTNNRFAGISTACIDCHRVDFTGATNPSHVSSNFSANCLQCHGMNGWIPATFDHTTTKFLLSGAHTAVPCQNCHTNGNYRLVYSSCYQCHQADFQTATNPNHVSGGFTQTCDQCHSTTAWTPATFDHATTKFPLAGAHTNVACQNCHTNGNYQLVYTNCYQCHGADFTNAVSPVPHTGFPTDCTKCHTTTAWSPSTFTHANVTPRFPNDNRHNGAACSQCHQTATNYTIICCQNGGCHNTCAGGGD